MSVQSSLSGKGSLDFIGGLTQLFHFEELLRTPGSARQPCAPHQTGLRLFPYSRLNSLRGFGGARMLSNSEDSSALPFPSVYFTSLPAGSNVTSTFLPFFGPSTS